MMNKSNSIIMFILAFLLISCKDKAQENNSNKSINQQTINFDNVLKCSDYSYDEGCFMTADYGCIYDPKGKNTFGNLIIYLIPKKKLQINDEQIEQENNKINGLTIDNYKQNFNIFLYLIDKQYLNYSKSGDPVYYQKPSYEEKLYTYDGKTNKWIFVNSIKILNESQNGKEQIWRKNFIIKQIEIEPKNVSSIIEIPKFIQSIESKDFALVKKQNCDLNKDNLEDFILVFKNNKEYESSDIKTKIAPVIVLINNGNNSYTKYENDNIYPNDFNDLYSNLAVKDNFFTVELANEIPNESTSSKYITFKYDNQNIVLHKYSEIIDWSSSKTDKINYSQKNFGIINFRDFNTNTIQDKSK